MEVKVLGSVSPYCKKEKNCPGYLVTSENTKLLLDCGPGITRNMNLPGDLDNLSIVLSHLHKDHYGDLLSLGYASYVFHNLGYLKDRIKVYIPEADYQKEVERYTDEDGWASSKPIQKVLADYAFLQDFGDEHFLEFITYKPTDSLNFGPLTVDFAKNPHQINTFSTRVVDNDEILVYSGDTGYLGNPLVDFAANADLLLCEATFLRGQARKGNNHLYAYEAATIAKDAAVKSLVLTHFFPEIEKQEYVDEAREIFPNVQAAEEGKVLKIGGKK